MNQKIAQAVSRQLTLLITVINLSIEQRLKELKPHQLIQLEWELHSWARRILRGEGPSEGPTYIEEGAYEGTKEGTPEGAPSNPRDPSREPFKFPFYSPHRLIKLAHSHPLWARIEEELVRRDRASPQLSLEEETAIILALRDYKKEKGWISIESNKGR